MNSPGSSLHRYRVVLFLFTALTVVYIGLTIWAYSRLPERIPIHFDMNGVPDRWSGKAEFLWINLSVAVFLFVTFGLLSLFIPKIPDKWLNMPNKEYWLTSERREQSFADMNFYYVAMGILTLLLLGYIGWSAFEVAMERREALIYSWTGLGIYFVLLAVFCGLLFRRFRKPG